LQAQSGSERLSTNQPSESVGLVTAVNEECCCAIIGGCYFQSVMTSNSTQTLSADKQLSLVTHLMQVLSQGNGSGRSEQLLATIGNHCQWAAGRLWLLVDEQWQMQTDWADTPIERQLLPKTFDPPASAQPSFLPNTATSGGRVLIPILVDQHLLGWLEFASADSGPLDHSLVVLLVTIGGAIGYFLQQHDITEALAFSKAITASILDSSLDAIVSVDTDDIITEWNTAAEEMFGHRREQALGQLMYHLIIPLRMHARHLQGMQDHLDHDPRSGLGNRLLLTACRADGHEFPIELTVTRQQIAEQPFFTANIRDLSEQVVMQEQLRLIIEGVADGIIATDRAGQIIYANDTASSLLDCTFESGSINDCLATKHWFGDGGDEIPVSDLPSIAALTDQADHPLRKARISTVIEGQERWLQLTTSHIRDGQGAATMIISIVTDASALRQAELQLRSAEQLFTNVFDGITDSVVVVDHSDHIVYANPAAERLFEYADHAALVADDLVGLRAKFDFYDETGQQLPALHPLYSNGHTSAMIVELRPDQGASHWVNVRGMPLYDEHQVITSLILIFEDITIAREIAAELQRSRDEFHTILEGVSEPITARDPQGNIIYLNQAALATLSWDDRQTMFRDHPQGIPPHMVVVDEQGAVIDRQHLPHARIRAGEGDVIIEVLGLPQPDRSTIWLRTQATAIRSADGELTMVLTINEDITVQHEREANLRAIVATLQASILPERLPDIPGVAFGSAFLPRGGVFHEVGGDFYDVFALDRERWLMMVGDVSGKGPEAASLTALCRHSLRGLALSTSDPIVLLDGLNRVLINYVANDRFATIIISTIEVTETGVTLRLGLGGHPQPLVISRSGSIREVGIPGMIVGAVADRPPSQTHTIELVPGDLLVCYTDGVVEAFDAARVMFDLPTVLEQCIGLGAQDTAYAIEQAVLAHTGTVPNDDVAILALEVLER
jgi:PAS domain S-box-containing protein